MNSNVTFNKELFADLLEKSKGDRSINQFANETSISAAHISRFLRQMIDTPPSPETIAKLSSKAHNDVSYKDLMAAAGHIDVSEGIYNEDIDHLVPSSIQSTDYTIERVSPFERKNQYELLEKKFFQIILSYLYDVPFQWNIQKPEGRHAFPDMTIDIDNKGYNKWYIDFKGNIDARKGLGLQPFYVYGQIAIMELFPTDKFTIAVNSEHYYNQFLKRPPKSLRANVYVMLVDLEKGEIVNEEKLCSFS